MIDYAEFIKDPPVEIDSSASDWLLNQTILVTGGGGSIGREICARLLRYPVRSVVAIGRSEEPLFRLSNELKDSRLHIEIADVQNAYHIQRVANKFQPGIVFHTAAYKHVGLMERHIVEAVQNNILGTVNLFSNLRDSHFVFVSTDKAIFPASVMGASKRFCEKYLTTRRASGANIDIVRLGNVIGSSGSVAEIFEKAAREGKPLIVSNPAMKRFFITPTNAAALIIQAGAIQASASYMVKMGPEISIFDLAQFIQSQYEQSGEIKIGTALPVEKITEELFDRPATELPGKRLFRLDEEVFHQSHIDGFIELFAGSVWDPERLKGMLFKSVRVQ